MLYKLNRLDNRHEYQKVKRVEKCINAGRQDAPMGEAEYEDNTTAGFIESEKWENSNINY